MQNPPIQDKELHAFVEDIGPSREPTVRIYRLDADQKQTKTLFRKQTRVGEVLLSDFSHDPSYIFEYLRSEFGAGTFLLRTVRPNGTYDPSKVVHVGRIDKHLTAVQEPKDESWKRFRGNSSLFQKYSQGKKLRH